jgi:4-aminobutyrate--pyruvate transaminase
MASPPNPTANPNSLASRDIAYHLHPYTNQSLFPKQGPIIITHGEGIQVFDEDGKAYIEGMAGLWCANLGMGNQDRMLKAVTRQLERLPYYHTFASKTSDITIELAERLIAMAPAPMSKVLFSNSGSEANDTAIKPCLSG